MNVENALLVDVGNSRVKWGLGKGGRLVPGEAFASCAAGLEDELDRHWSALPPPSAAVVANVAGAERGESLRRWLFAHWGVEARFVRASGRAHGVLNAYEEPTALGVDRWVGLLAGYHLCRGAVCVADCGTALTLDAVDSQGRHLGGVIAPGLGLMRQSLKQGTQGVFQVAGGHPCVLARNTADAVHSGVLHMAAGAIEHFLRAAERRLSSAPRLMLTGGDAESIAAELRLPFALVPDLVLTGLLLIAEGDS